MHATAEVVELAEDAIEFAFSAESLQAIEQIRLRRAPVPFTRSPGASLTQATRVHSPHTPAHRLEKCRRRRRENVNRCEFPTADSGRVELPSRLVLISSLLMNSLGSTAALDPLRRLVEKMETLQRKSAEMYPDSACFGQGATMSRAQDPDCQ